jgi:hypothetical protein
MRGTKLALSDWAVVVRFDDGSAATLVGSAGPPELCVGADDAGRASRKRRGLLARKPGHDRV